MIPIVKIILRHLILDTRVGAILERICQFQSKSEVGFKSPWKSNSIKIQSP